MEEFKAIAEGYEVSTFGNVRSTKYKRGVYGFGSVALGKKYGVEHSTVLKIIKES